MRLGETDPSSVVKDYNQANVGSNKLQGAAASTVNFIMNKVPSSTNKLILAAVASKGYDNQPFHSGGHDHQEAASGVYIPPKE